MEPEYQDWKVKNLLKDANNETQANNTSGVTKAKDALNKNYHDAMNLQKDANLPGYLQVGGGFIIAMGAILALIEIAIFIGIFPGIYAGFSVDLNDDATVDKVKFISIYFGSLVVITVLIVIVLANYIKKDALKDFDGGTGAGSTKADGLTARVTRSRQGVVIGIGVIIATFLVVTLISIIFHRNDLKFVTIIAPLFLFTFIVSVSALTFGGIAISSAIAGIYMYYELKDGNPDNDTQQFKNARICSCILLSFILIIILMILITL